MKIVIIDLENEENMAIELIMVRYCWCFAYYSEAEQYVNKIREKVSTTFKANSATTEDHEYSLFPLSL